MGCGASKAPIGLDEPMGMRDGESHCYPIGTATSRANHHQPLEPDISNELCSLTDCRALSRSLSLSLSLTHSLGHPHPHPHPPAHRLYFCVFAGAGCGGPSPGLSPAQINTDVVYRLVEQDMEPMTGGESHTPRLAMSWRVEVLPYHRTAPQPLPHLTRRIAPANGVLTPARDHRCSVRCAWCEVAGQVQTPN
jgi:hypothetical protein